MDINNLLIPGEEVLYKCAYETTVTYEKEVERDNGLLLRKTGYNAKSLAAMNDYMRDEILEEAGIDPEDWEDLEPETVEVKESRETKVYVTTFRIVHCWNGGAYALKLSDITSIGLYDRDVENNNDADICDGDYGIKYNGSTKWFASKQVRDDLYLELSRAIFEQ